MYLNKDRIRCASFVSGLLGLLGSGLSLGAIFLPWWDVGSSEELLNLNNAPAVIASLWGFHFLNPPSWVTSPMPRDASTWQAYCARDADRSKASPGPGSSEGFVNDTEDDDFGGLSSTTTEFIVELDPMDNSSNDTNITNDTNYSSTSTTGTHTRTITSSTITSVTTMDPALLQELRGRTTPIPDPPLHPGTCELIPFLKTLLLTSSALGPGAVLLFFLARAFSSLLALLAGALAAASACGLGAIAIFMAGLLSFRGLLSATGPQFVVGGMIFAGGSAVLAVYNSVKALNPLPPRQVVIGGEAEDSDEGNEEKTPEAVAAKRKEKEARLKLSRMTRFRAATDRDKRKARPSQRILQAGKKRPEAMMRLLNWGRRKGQGGRFGKKVPLQWLEAAFQEIDTEGRGVISLDEFMATIAKCGFRTSRGSFERILSELNQERKGYLDLREFIGFFRMVEESLKRDARGKSKALLALYLCNFCFFLHVAVLCTILILLVRREATSTPEDQADPIHQAESQLLSTTLQLVSFSLLGFFISVVAVPLLRLTVGSSIGAWCGHFRGVLREWRRKWRGEAPQDEGDLEAGTPTLSRRTSNASIASAFSARSQHSDGGAVSGTRSQRSQRSHRSGDGGAVSRATSTATRRTSRASLGSVESIGLGGRKPWWKRFQSKLFPKKRKRRRRTSCLEDSAYDMSKFEDAQRRAMAASMEPVSTFSPMQVRNLHVAHLPSAVTAAPPTQLAPYLPGTPSGIYSEPTSELGFGRSRPLSRESNGRSFGQLEDERQERS